MELGAHKNHVEVLVALNASDEDLEELLHGGDDHVFSADEVDHYFLDPCEVHRRHAAADARPLLAFPTVPVERVFSRSRAVRLSALQRQFFRYFQWVRRQLSLQKFQSHIHV